MTEEKKCIKFIEKLQALCDEYDAGIFRCNIQSKETDAPLSALRIRVGRKYVLMPHSDGINSINLSNVIAHLKYESIQG